MAQRAMPLVGDPEPVEVIYEDDDIIAVNKPPHVISAPKHRYKVCHLRHNSHWLNLGLAYRVNELFNVS